MGVKTNRILVLPGNRSRHHNAKREDMYFDNMNNTNQLAC